MANRLATQASPYLRQHAENPVDWFPWGPEALAKARTENKPILLSIGYAACHWCHVMERESFSDRRIAGLMNEWFVSVKVDREERPDLDAIYMDAIQAMSGHGGWPMTVFLTPDEKPFYGGTYYPPEDRHGMPGFPRVLEAVHDAWLNRSEDIRRQADAVTAHITQRLQTSHEREHDLTEMTFRAATGALRTSFDAEWGGFGNAPKFPQPMVIDFLMRMHARGEPDALAMADATLSAMGRGGIFDHLGGGFHRYSTDRHWLVPHFEKMLYDNGLLLGTFSRGWLVTGNPLYRRVALLTAEYLLNDMRHPEGGFFSSQDADSDGVEGRYYVWNDAEMRAIAGDDAAAFFGVTPAGNWEGSNILWLPHETMPNRAIEQARLDLLGTRAKRTAPATDHKIVAAWNGLAISGLCDAGRVFKRPELIDAAAQAARFVLASMRDEKGRLMRSWTEGHTSVPAFLDDHANMALACLDLYESTFEESWYQEARRLIDDMTRLFADADGGFFDTGTDAPSLLIRPKSMYDNAMPSGNAAATEVLLRLGALTGDVSEEIRATAMLRALQPAMASSPTGFGSWLADLDLVLGTTKQIAISGDPSADATRALVSEVWSRYIPNKVLAVGRPDATAVPLLRDREERDGLPTAWVCESFVCLRPVTEPDQLATVLTQA